MEKFKAGMPFDKAANLWLKNKRPPFIAEKTYHEYLMHAATLKRHFKSKPLNRITAERIRKYQHDRLKEILENHDARLKKGRKARKDSGHHCINHECGVLRQILKKVKRWIAIEENYQPLPLPNKSPGRALTDEQRQQLFEVALSDIQYLSAYSAAGIAINTTGGPKEVSTIRLGDIDLKRRLLTIRGSKNENRTRIVGINDDCLKYIEIALKRARSCGSFLPEHFLFPFCTRRHDWDPERRQMGFKWGWNKLRIAAGMPWLRFYDLRHHSSTVLLEDEESSEDTVETIAGRVTEEMKKWYSHIRIKRIQHAMKALEPGGRYEQNVAVSNTRLNNADIIEMVRHDLSPAVILTKMASSAGDYDTSIEQLKALKAAAVSDDLVAFMIQAMATIRRVRGKTAGEALPSPR